MANIHFIIELTAARIVRLPVTVVILAHAVNIVFVCIGKSSRKKKVRTNIN